MIIRNQQNGLLFLQIIILVINRYWYPLRTRGG